MTDFIEQIYHLKKDYTGILFLDRDGTINESVMYLTNEKQMKFLPKVIDSIKLLNQNNIAVVVITNQPIIARGMVTVNELKKINDVLVDHLSKQGAFIDAIYSCPHHPEKDHRDIPPFARKYRIECVCRKPGIAMFQKAVTKFGTKKTFGMIGDHKRDILAGQNFGIRTVFLKIDQSTHDQLHDVAPDFICDNLLDAVEKLL